MNFPLAELERRLSNLIRIGTIESVDFGIDRCRVKVDDLITGPLPWLTANAGAEAISWSAPSVGEQVLLFSPFGDFSQGVVLPSLYRAAHGAPSSDPAEHSTHYKDGTVISYNSDTHTLTINCTGDVNVIAGGDVNLGGIGGKPVARIGDRVNVGAGSSAGMWPIEEGSSKVNAT